MSQHNDYLKAYLILWELLDMRWMLVVCSSYVPASLGNANDGKDTEKGEEDIGLTLEVGSNST